MPATINLNGHPATAWQGQPSTDPSTLLKSSCPKQWNRCQRIIQSSFTSTLQDTNTNITPSSNGFVWSAFHAYSSHHHLVLRPEDIWFAILTQLSFYINAHAEELRAFFVSHEGKKELEAVSVVADFAALALQMTDLLAKNVSDPQLRDWVMPDFTTTTYYDKVVGAVLFMGALQAYFEYQFTVCCGLPSVTLLGTVADWEKILAKLDMIDQLDEEPTQFASMLRPVLKHMILTFEDPAAAEVMSFFKRIVHQHEVGSGTNYLSGWLTAFCWWDDKGKAKRLTNKWDDERNVLFDEIEYPYVDIDSIPLGFASVPVKVDDNGHEYNATLVAGSVGIEGKSWNASTATPSALGMQTAQEVLSSNETSSDAETILDTIQPVSGWWMYENEALSQTAAREAEKKQLADALEKQKRETQAMSVHEQSAYYFSSERGREYFRLSDKLRELEAF